MRVVFIVIILVLIVSGAYAAPMSGSAKTLGGGSSSVAHCQVQETNIAAGNIISSINAKVKCDLTGSYNVTSTVTSGAASGSGLQAASLTANTLATVAIAISPSVTISGATYNADVRVKK